MRSWFMFFQLLLSLLSIRRYLAIIRLSLTTHLTLFLFTRIRFSLLARFCEIACWTYLLDIFSITRLQTLIPLSLEGTFIHSSPHLHFSSLVFILQWQIVVILQLFCSCSRFIQCRLLSPSHSLHGAYFLSWVVLSGTSQRIFIKLFNCTVKALLMWITCHIPLLVLQQRYSTHRLRGWLVLWLLHHLVQIVSRVVRVVRTFLAHSVLF